MEVVMNATDVLQHLKRGCARCFSVLHNGLAVLGFAAVVTLLVQGGKIRPELWPGNSASGAIRHDGVIAQAQAVEPALDPAEDSRYKTLANFLSRRYRVASEVTAEVVSS